MYIPVLKSTKVFYFYQAVTCAKVAGKVHFYAPYFFSKVHWRLYECGQKKEKEKKKKASSEVL